MSNVYKKLIEARVRLAQSGLKKTGKNQSFKYFELEDFLPKTQEIFKELGLCGVVSFGSDFAELKIVDADDPQSFVEIKSPDVRASMKGCTDIQNLGGTQTYQRRYLWLTAMEIAECDQIDSAPLKKTQGTSEAELAHVQRIESTVLADIENSVTKAESLEKLKESYTRIHKDLKAFEGSANNTIKTKATYLLKVLVDAKDKRKVVLEKLLAQSDDEFYEAA